MNKKKISLGVDDFKRIIEEKSYYVDKSLLIKEIIDSSSLVTLITRPRRFGKTLNMSMLKYFFSKDKKDNSYLFKNLLIQKEKSDEYRKEQGRYPVIFLSLKKAKSDNWEKTYSEMKEIIAEEFKKHLYLLNGNIMSEAEKKEYLSVVEKKGKQIRYENSLFDLTKYLEKYYKEKCIILIDEYDTPLQKGYLEGYFEDVLSFMKSFLGEGLKGNPSLKRGVLTGIMKIAKESIFSDFNNPVVSTILSGDYKDKFGFTEKEVEDLVRYYELEDKLKEIKLWYNGYIFGNNEIIYNPWSILNFLRKPENGLKPYWLNTGDMTLIKRVLQLDKASSKKTIEELIENKIVKKQLLSNIVYQNIETNSDVGYSFLAHSGYLKVKVNKDKDEIIDYTISIPNKEISLVYNKILKNYFEEDIIISDSTKSLINSLRNENLEKFEIILNDIYASFVSFNDPKLKLKYVEEENKHESFHHGFILGLLMYGENEYIIDSNKEYGKGRPDIVLIPRDNDKAAYIIEFKWSSIRSNTTLDKLTLKAINQIIDKKYAFEVRKKYEVKKIISIGIGFKGTNLKVIIKNK